MRIFKRIFTALISFVITLSLTVSCFGVVFVPVTPTVEGLPGYTLSESFVNETKRYLDNAKTKIIQNGIYNAEAITAWNDFIDAYYEIATQANVAFIMYSSDSSSEAYKSNYLFASESYNDIYALYMKALQAIDNHEQSVGISKDDSFFRDMGESDMNRIRKHTEKVSQLENEVTELQVKYGELASDVFYDESINIYKQIVDKNNQIAIEYGFTNYYDYASDYVYSRDYTNGQLVEFRNNVGKELPSLITTLKGNLESAKAKLTDDDKKLLDGILISAYNKTSVNYWDKYVESYTGANAKTYLKHAFDNKNVMFADGANSKGMAFNAYLPTYKKSYCYFGPGYQDVFTVSHEIGHYYAGLFQEHGTTSMDLNETHSQGNEMLLLEYLSNEITATSFDCLELNKLSGILSTVLVSTIVDEFEYYVYTNPSVIANYTSADFDAKMNEICQNYGGTDFIKTLGNSFDINNYWRLVVAEQPAYYISYATSGISAFNLYIEADASRAEARKIYAKLLEQKSEGLGFAGSLTNAGLTSPFTMTAFEKINYFVFKISPVIPNDSEQDSSIDESSSESIGESDSVNQSNESESLSVA